MNRNDTTDTLVEEFLGRIRIGDVPNIEDFIAQHPAADDPEELRGLLVTLLDIERLTFTSPNGDEDMPMPDLTSCGYRLLKKIGVGGMGVVYEAIQVNLGRRVAVKLLRPELLADPEIREIFSLEARILARFDHGGIVRILGTGQCADTFFYAMELVDGQALDTLPHKPNEKQVLQWATEAADALAYAHSHGIIHGDIKPANLLLDRNGHIRICDFGLAFASQTPAPNSPRDGTRRYMAPELRQGDDKGFSSDQYALCASLAEISAAEPFDKDADHFHLLRNSHLAAVLKKGLRADPKDRYQAIGELRDDLRRIERHEPVTAEQTSLVVHMGLFCRRHPILTVSVALLMLFVAAVLHGLLRTEAAMRLAQRNAATANSAIAKVFDQIVKLPPAPENAALLAQLIPYYEQIVANPNIPASELSDALAKLARTAMHTGDYPLAEQTLRRILTIKDSSAILSQLAYTLFRQGKHEESSALFRSLISRYAKGTPQERLDVANAHLHFLQENSGGDASDDRQAARQILLDCLAESPENDRALFLYARLLQLSHGASIEPIPLLPTDPLEILDEISSRNPNNGRYWRTFIDCATEWLTHADPSEGCPDTIDSALDKSDVMLWRFLNQPHAVSSALALKRAFGRWIRLSDPRHGPARGPTSIAILSRALLNQPGLPEQDQSNLIAFTLDAMEERAHHPRRHFGFRHSPGRRLEDLKEFLEDHSLPRKDEFLQRIRKLEENAASDPNADPADSRVLSP